MFAAASVETISEMRSSLVSLRGVRERERSVSSARRAFRLGHIADFSSTNVAKDKKPDPLLEGEESSSGADLADENIEAGATSNGDASPQDRGVGKRQPAKAVKRHGWGRKIFRGYVRYLVLIVSLLGFTAARSLDITFNLTLICMSKPDGNGTAVLTPSEGTILLSTSGAGALLSALPFAVILHSIGGRGSFTTVLFLSSCASIAFPFVVKSASSLWAIPLRLLHGIGVGSVFPMVGLVSTHWAADSELATFVTLLTAGAQLSQIFTMPLSAHLCVTTGWEWAFWGHGAIGFPLAILFFVLFRDAPDRHPFIGRKELRHIHDMPMTGEGGLTARSFSSRRQLPSLLSLNTSRAAVGLDDDRTLEQVAEQHSEPVPYAAILTSIPIWAIWTAFLGTSFGMQFVVQFMPTYLNRLLSVAVERTGAAAVLPALAQLVIKIVAGALAAKCCACISVRAQLQLCNSLAMVGCALFLLPLGFVTEVGEAAPVLAMFCFTTAIALLGLVSLGSMRASALVARQHAPFVMAIMQLMVCLGMLLTPLLVKSTVTDFADVGGWRQVIYTVGVILFLTNLLFCTLCDSEAAAWTKKSSASAASPKSKTNGTTPMLVVTPPPLDEAEEEEKRRFDVKS